MSSQVVLATAGYDHSIRFWEATSGLCYRTLQYADSQVESHAQPVLQKRLASQKYLRECLLQVNKLEITADKHLLAAAGNPHIRLYEVNSSNPQAVQSYDSHTNNVTAVILGGIKLKIETGTRAYMLNSSWSSCCDFFILWSAGWLPERRQMDVLRL